MLMVTDEKSEIPTSDERTGRKKEVDNGKYEEEMGVTSN